MKVKEVLDQLFQNVTFDTSFYKKLVVNNIEFITKSDDHKHLFGAKLIGCYYLKYTMYDKNIFYNNLFDMEAEEVIQQINKISTINKNFKIARDDVNLICFYIAHRFLSNESLSEEKRFEYAKEVLNYFSYRTLVLISSNYFIYPISEEKAVSLIERLSNKYIIKRVKNWNEYCQYRSQEYLESKYYDLVLKMNKDVDLPNAINDLFIRTKDTLKNIYGEFLDMMESDEIIKSRKNVVNDIEGQEVILDRLNTPETYIIKMESILTDSSVFIKKEFLDVTIDIINTLSYKQLEEGLRYCLDYSHVNSQHHDQVKKFFKEILINGIEYLHKNQIYISNQTNVLVAINSLVGNILYARGSEIGIKKLKDDGEKLVKACYKYFKAPVNDRTVKNIRNGIYVYIFLRALVD